MSESGALKELAEKVAADITETDQLRMGFTMDEVNRINASLWAYECALHQHGAETSPEDALRFHYSLDEQIQAKVQRAFIMFGRKLEACAGLEPAT
jgi:hypothetical protein